MKLAVLFLTLLFLNPVFAQRKAALLEQGKQIGKTHFEPGDTDKGGKGQTIDGIEGSSREMLKTHFHAHLSLFHRGKQIAIPYGIGIVKPFKVERGFVGEGSGYYWLHTHDATGIIHVAAPAARPCALGDFFAVGRQPLKPANPAGLRVKVRAFVDAKLFSGDPRSIVLKP